MKHLAFLALGGLLLAPLTEAANFNYEKAERANEKATCANQALNDRDAEMSVKYHFLRDLFVTGDRGAIQDRQQDWLCKRRRCGGDTDCLSHAYTQRIDKPDKQCAGIGKSL